MMPKSRFRWNSQLNTEQLPSIKSYYFCLFVFFFFCIRNNNFKLDLTRVQPVEPSFEARRVEMLFSEKIRIDVLT